MEECSRNPTSYKYNSATITLNNPTLGYTFTDDRKYGTTAQTSVTIASGSYGNKNYTANWSVNKYYYDVNPNAGIASFDITYGGTTETKLTDFYRQLDYGTQVTIKNVVAKAGYTYTGYTLSGTLTKINSSKTKI